MAHCCQRTGQKVRTRQPGSDLPSGNRLDQDAFIEKVRTSLETTPNLVVCISEGIHDNTSTFICEYSNDVGTDTFGHKMLTGSGKYLENLVKERIGVKSAPLS